MMRMLRVVACLCVMLGGPLFGAQTAYAQYSPEFVPGTEFQPVLEDEALAIASPHPLVLSAQDAAGLQFDYLVALEPGMSREFGLKYSDDGSVELVREQVITIADRSGNPRPTAKARSYPETLYMGIGVDEAASSRICLLVTFSSNDGLSATELRRAALGTLGTGMWVFDLTGDGWLEVKVDWFSGRAGGGGVDIYRITPAGELQYLSETKQHSSLWSEWGSRELIDWDADGACEMQITNYLIGPNGYYCNEMLSFDAESQLWVAVGETNGYLEPQQEFYAKLYAELVKVFKQPDAYLIEDGSIDAGYYVEIDQELYLVDSFLMMGRDEHRGKVLASVAGAAGIDIEGLVSP